MNLIISTPAAEHPAEYPAEYQKLGTFRMDMSISTGDMCNGWMDGWVKEWIEG